MKKYLSFLFPFAALLGASLYGWTLSVGTDEKGLYPAAHPGWIGYLILTAAVLTVLFCLRGKIPSAETGLAPIGHLFGTLGFFLLFLTGVKNRDFLSAVGALLSAVAMAVLTRQRWTQKTPAASLYAVPCLYLIYALFRLNLRYGGEPELIRFLPQFLAVFSAAIATFQIWGQSVGRGKTTTRIFWILAGGYLCLAAIPATSWAYGALALFLLMSI